MSDNPSPIFTPLNPSPKLVAEMTGLSLRQCELEVSQQHKLKRMLRTIRASRRGLSQRRSNTFTLKRPQLAGAHEADASINGSASGAIRPNGGSLRTRASSGILGEEASTEWKEADQSLKRLDNVSINIADNPGPEELKRRVASLFSDVFCPLAPIEAANVNLTRISGAMTNAVFMVTISPPPAALSHTPPAALSHTPQVYKWIRSNPASVDKETAATGKAETRLPSKYLLRVYGIGVDEIIPRNKELYWLSQLSSLGFGPRLFGIFSNGRLEEFLESSTLTREDIRMPSTSKHIARRMCELHSLVSYYRPFGGNDELRKQIEEESKSDPIPEGVDLSGYPELWSNIENWLPLIKKKRTQITGVCKRSPGCMKLLNSWDSIVNASSLLRRVIDEAQSPIVFAHDDLQYGNILRLSSTGELVVVDFEYAGYNYRGFDIANHFCEWMADYHHPVHPHLLDESSYPTKSERYSFFRTYVKAKAFLDANMKADANIVESEDGRSIQLRSITLDDSCIDREVEKLDNEVAPFVMASHLHWGIWGLLQACSSNIDFDYVEYGTQRLSIFLRMLDTYKQGLH